MIKLKKISICLSLFTIVVVSFNSCNKQEKVYNLYRCPCPKEILEMVDNESDIYWDCSWQASYNEGKVFLKLDEDGELLYVTRTYKQ